jgi:8-oxo-dGTP diphosphatase
MNTEQKNWRHYTVGFCFSPSLEEVVLIRKAKPDWQKGKLNGVGGSFEEGEDMFQCMEREFKEETTIEQKGWQHFATGWYDCHQGSCAVHYLVSRFEARHHFIPRMPIEQPDWYSINLVHTHLIIPNLLWLIPMAEMKLTRPDWKEAGRVELNF